MAGQTLSHYRLIEQIGAGGMGIVYRAHDLDLERDVALKVLPPGMLADEAARRRFRKEALALAKLNHPNIATVHEFGSQDEVDFLVTEYIPGITLDVRLKDGSLPLKDVERLGTQLAQGLSAAHEQNVVHRDLKPGNLRITPDGRLKILDFGLAQLMPNGAKADLQATLTQTTSAVVGTVPYMAPEQLRGEPADARTDIWAAGAVLYEMATGKRPFSEQNGPMLINAILNHEPQAPSSVNRNISPALEHVILKALAKDSKHRYQTARELGVDLERITAGIPAIASSRRKATPLLVIAGSVAAILLLALAGYFWRQHEFGSRVASSENTVTPRPAVAVLGFKNLAGRPDMAWLSTALSEMLTTELAAGEQLRTIPEESVAQMKVSLAPPETDSYNKETLAKIRQILGTDKVVLGSYLPLGEGEIRVDLRLQDTVGGETLAAVSAKGTEAHLDEVVSQIGAELRAKMGVAELTASDQAMVKAAAPRNPEAARAYAEGLAKLRVFDFLGARDLLAKAVSLEPNFALSHEALGTAWSSLGDDAKAKAEAQKAFELSEGLSREDRLAIEGRYREAMGETDKAIDLYQALFQFYPDDLDYGLRLAATQAAAGKNQAAMATIARLRQLPAPERDDPRIDLVEGTASRLRGDFKGALASAQRASVKGEVQGSPLVTAKAKTMECMATRNLGDARSAMEICEQAEKTYAASGDLNGVAQVLNNLGNARYDQGDLQGAKKTYEETLATYRKIGNQRGIAGAMDNLANVLVDMGKPGDATALSQQALKIYREIGDFTGEGETLNNIAAQHVAEGNFAEATKGFGEALEIWRKKGDTNGTATALTNLGEMLLNQGDLNGAKAKYEEALKIFRETEQKDKSGYPLFGLGEVAIAQGDFHAAQDRFNEVLAISRATGDKHQVSAALAGLGEALRQQGDLTAARANYAESLEIRKEIGEKATIAESNVGLAKIALAERKFAEAESLAKSGLEEFHSEKLREGEIFARVALAETYLAETKNDDAQKQLEAAAGLVRKSMMVPARLEYEIAAARTAAANGRNAQAMSGLRQALDEARKFGYGGYPYEIQLAMAEAEIRAGQNTAGLLRMKEVEKEARSKGYGNIANRAAGKT